VSSFESKGEQVGELPVLGVGDGDILARRGDGWVEQVVLDLFVKFQLASGRISARRSGSWRGVASIASNSRRMSRWCPVSTSSASGPSATARDCGDTIIRPVCAVARGESGCFTLYNPRRPLFGGQR
jgi:hypothetical protein